MSRFAEDVPLFSVANSVAKSKWFSKVSCCVRSKAARFILLWISGVLLVYSFFNIDNEFISRSSWAIQIYIAFIVSVIAVFAPMAGLLTDLKFSRYKTVTCSSCFLLIEIVLLLIAVSGFIAAKKYREHYAVGFFLFLTGIIVITLLVFIVNSIRFGMDQLHDSPTEDSILFVKN